jgi:hypothetical protein
MIGRRQGSDARKWDEKEDVLRSTAMKNRYNQELIEGLVRVIGATGPTHDLIGEKILVAAILELVQLRTTVRKLRGEVPADYIDEEASKPVDPDYPGSIITEGNKELTQALAWVIRTSLPLRDVEAERILLDAIQELLDLRKEERALLGLPPYEPEVIFGKKMN